MSRTKDPVRDAAAVEQIEREKAEYRQRLIQTPECLGDGKGNCKGECRCPCYVAGRPEK